jgi:hypothetical protein
MLVYWTVIESASSNVQIHVMFFFVCNFCVYLVDVQYLHVALIYCDQYKLPCSLWIWMWSTLGQKLLSLTWSKEIAHTKPLVPNWYSWTMHWKNWKIYWQAVHQRRHLQGHWTVLRCVCTEYVTWDIEKVFAVSKISLLMMLLQFFFLRCCLCRIACAHWCETFRL